MAQSSRERYRVAPVRAQRRPWPFPLNIYQTAIGRKWVRPSPASAWSASS